jgi:GTP pyrophosphokinase
MIRQFELVERVKSYDPDADEDMLNRAYVFAMKAHGSQTRASSIPPLSLRLCCTIRLRIPMPP